MLRFADILSLGESVFDLDPVGLIKNNVCSPIRLFIKDEPHNRSKVERGKLRLISGVAVDDQVIDRMVYGVQNNREIASWETCPSKPGIGLHDEGLRSVSAQLVQMLAKGSVQSTDIKGWDWSVQKFELDDDAEARRRLAGAPRGSLFDFLLRVRAHCAANKVFCLPDGSLVAQTHPGVQPSGWYCTSSSNSRMRVMARVNALQLAGESTEDALRIMAMGDDAVEGEIGERALSWYEEMGHQIKERHVSSSLDGVEFCSHRFSSSRMAYPVNMWKTTFRFFSHSLSSDQWLDWFAQLRGDLRHVPGVDGVIESCAAHAEWAKSYGEKKEQSKKVGTASPPPTSGW